MITSGDLKLMMGYVGDPRRLPMNESTGGESVVFGSTGGVCGLAGFAERCEAGHLLDPDGQPAHAPRPSWEDPDGINCLSGCLFNLTACRLVRWCQEEEWKSLSNAGMSLAH